jgi:hypothetical protein
MVKDVVERLAFAYLHRITVFQTEGTASVGLMSALKNRGPWMNGERGSTVNIRTNRGHDLAMTFPRRVSNQDEKVTPQSMLVLWQCTYLCSRFTRRQRDTFSEGVDHRSFGNGNGRTWASENYQTAKGRDGSFPTGS